MQKCTAATINYLILSVSTYTKFHYPHEPTLANWSCIDSISSSRVAVFYLYCASLNSIRNGLEGGLRQIPNWATVRRLLKYENEHDPCNTRPGGALGRIWNRSSCQHYHCRSTLRMMALMGHRFSIFYDNAIHECGRVVLISHQFRGNSHRDNSSALCGCQCLWNSRKLFEPSLCWLLLAQFTYSSVLPLIDWPRSVRISLFFSLGLVGQIWQWTL